MQLKVVERIEQIGPETWNRLANSDDPFISYAFLQALEQQGCVSAQLGWQPRHLLLLDDNDQAIAAAPLYHKTNSYGELVFDWSWAEAHERLGLTYYPKLVSAIPYTPATGPRLLAINQEAADKLAVLARNYAIEESYSSLHWLFGRAADQTSLAQAGYLQRCDVQYHWHNQHYRDFTDFLDRFASAKRKQVKRERRRVGEAGIACEVVHGDEASPALWQHMHALYRQTFEHKWGMPTLNLGFFMQLGETLGRRVVLIVARRDDNIIAGAICLRSDTTLYGRHWGSYELIDNLHFEVCYYQGIEYCIREGLMRFEPGAQGEYKIARGFEPVLTNSAHWIRDPRMAASIEDFLRREKRAIVDYQTELQRHVPFKSLD